MNPGGITSDNGQGASLIHEPSEDDLDAFAATFTTLGSLHRTAPGPEQLSTLLGMINEWPRKGCLAAGAHHPAVSSGLTMWRLSCDKAESWQDVASDHDRLYGDSAVAVVAPYESVHRSEEGLVFDEHTLQVRTCYARLELVTPNMNREPDDHIGLELDFLAQGCLHALDARESHDTDQSHHVLMVVADFLHTHVFVWAPSFLSRVTEYARTSFMQGVALLTIGTLDEFDECLVEHRHW